MNRTQLVSLLKKNIDELILLTEGFAEMSVYPTAILNLAKNKTEDIKSYIEQLGSIQTLAAPSTVTPPEETHTFVAPDTPEEIEEQMITALETSALIEVPDDKVKAEEVREEEVIEQIEDFNETEIEEPPVIEKNTVEKIITIAEKLAAQTITRNQLHSKTEATAVNDSIAHKKVEDIRQAISLGDRFRFQRELFKNNGEEMNKMLNYINLLASYDEIVSFLQSKYKWAEDHPVANDFYQIIKRKF